MRRRIGLCLVPLIWAAFIWSSGQVVPPAALVAQVAPRVAPAAPYFSVADYGAIGDANPARAAANTAAFKSAIAAAASSNPSGTVYVPMSRGYCVQNGQISLGSSSLVIRGDATMGASAGGLTSSIIGQGQGHTISVAGTGCAVRGLTFTSTGQTDHDAAVFITGTQCSISDLCLGSPSIGIEVSFPADQAGECWIRDVLVGGRIKTSGVSVNAGNAAVQIDHLLTFNVGDVQPPYGVVVTSCGELLMTQCDIDNCGTNLAIVPGLGGVHGQYANAIFISGCLFDNGSGPGQVLVQPQTDAFCSIIRFVNCWASTVNNNHGGWNTNGFMFVGDQSRPTAWGVLPIQDVSMTNCVGRSFVQHCGLYARGVQGLSVMNSTFTGCYTGIQVGVGCADFILTGNKCGNYTPPPVGGASGGNESWGILVEPNGAGVITGNVLRGNGAGGIWNQWPNAGQVIWGNVQ